MIVSLHLEYNTQWGEQIFLCFNAKPETNSYLPTTALALNNDGHGHWFIQVEGDKPSGCTYHYFVVRHNRIIRTEWGDGHQLPLSADRLPEASSLQIFDAWKENPIDQPFFSSAFTQSIFGHPSVCQEAAIDRIAQTGTLTLQCEAATIRKGQILAVCGNAPALGKWIPQQAAIMDASEQPIWNLTVDRAALSFPMLYKFVILDEKTHDLIAWEGGCNRYFDPGTIQTDDAIVVRNLRFENPQHPWRGAGVAIPIFSLRSRQSGGIGEFCDLRLLVDWAEATHQSIIQILPVNDTTITRTWRDSYPYNSNSSFALNPIYIRLRQIGHLADKAKMDAFERKLQQLNRLPAVDYEKVLSLKWDYLKLIYKQNGAADLASEGYQTFYTHNRHWLDAYAVFCHLRDKYKTANFEEWKESHYTPELIEQLDVPGSKSAVEIGLHKFIQYHLHLQLQDARDYAHAHGIVLKGDIPIGISRHSVDAWANSTLFHLDSQAGAPPDAFDKNGQNWGFPTYNWQALAADNYRWFKERFVKMSDYFDAYRIDHILGFFRIWEVPIHAVQGLLGHFNPAMPLSPQQMADDYGFTFHYDRHALPYVTDDSLDKLFADDEAAIKKVKNFFLDVPVDLPAIQYKNGTAPLKQSTDARIEKTESAKRTPSKRYTFSPRFSTQRGVEGYFKSRPESEQPLKLKLFSLLTEVLFVEDPQRPGYFHPRINGIDTASFRALDQRQQQTYRTLHEDFFYHRHNDFWRKEAMQKLPALIHATRMLVCGEDLGMIPACVPNVMNDLRILSLEIQRMPKSFDEFGCPAHYPYYSVCTTSSHDLSNLRAWWIEDPKQTQRYYTNVMQGIGDAPQTAEPWICAKIIEEHLQSPAMLTILPFQDWVSIDGSIRYPNPEEERINLPSNPDNYWRYRMHISLEELLAAHDLNRRIAEMIGKYDR